MTNLEKYAKNIVDEIKQSEIENIFCAIHTLTHEEGADCSDCCVACEMDAYKWMLAEAKGFGL